MIIEKPIPRPTLQLHQRYDISKIERFCTYHDEEDYSCNYRYSVPLEWDRDCDISDYPIYETLILIEKDQSIITLLKVDDDMYMVVNIYDEDNNFNL